MSRPSLPARVGLMLVSLTLGAVLVVLLHWRQGSAWMAGPMDLLIAWGWPLAPYIAIALAAVWPWTTQAGWYALAVTLVAIAAGGVPIIIGAPWYQLNAIVIPVTWTLQTAGAGLVLLISLTLYVIAWLRSEHRIAGNDR